MDEFLERLIAELTHRDGNYEVTACHLAATLHVAAAYAESHGGPDKYFRAAIANALTGCHQ